MDTNKPTISPDKEPTRSPKRRARWLRWLRWPLRFVAGLVIVLVLLVATAQTPWGSARIERLAENLVSGLLTDSRLEIGSLSGSFLWGLSGRDVKLYAGDSLVASIDTFEVSYNVLGFVAGTIDLGDVRLVKPEVMARQRADSTWDLLSVLPPSDPAAEPGEPIEMSIDALVVTDGSAKARFRTGRDSLVALENLQVAASGFSLGEELELEKMSLGVRGEAASLPAAVFLKIEASVGASTFRCDGCVLASVRSRLEVNGHFDWGGQSDTPGADLAVVVDSLAMADLAPFLPMIDATQVVSGSASLRGPPESISAEVDLGFGASQIELRGALVRDDSVSADLDLALTSVDPAVFWTASPMSGSLSGDLVVDLKGESIPSLTGSAMLRIYDAVLNGRRLTTSSVSVNVVDGRADINGALELPASRLEMDGWMTPFAETIEWALSGSAVSDDLGHIYPEAGDIESVSLRFQTEGSTASRVDYFRDTDVYLDELRYAGFIADSTHLTADLLDDGVRVEGVGKMNSQDTSARIGSFDFEGNVIFAEAIHLEIGRFEFEGLDVSLGLSAGGPISVLEGVVAGTVEIPKSGPVSGQADGSVSGLFLAIPIDDLQIEADLLGGSLAIDALAESASSLLDVQGTVLILEEGVPVTAEGTYRDLDLSSFTGDSMAHSNLDGAFQVEARWNSMSDHRIVIETELEPSTWNRQKIDYGRIEVDSDDGAADVRASIATPRGGVDVEAAVLVTDSLTSLTALGGTFSSVRVGDILGVESISTDLSGSVDLDLQASGIKGAVALQSSTINRATLRGGRLGITADGDSLLFDGLFDFDTGKIRLVGDSQFEDARTGVQAMFQIDSVDVSALAGMDSVSSSVNMGCSIVGTLSSLLDSELSGLCLAARSRLDRMVVDSLRVAADLNSGTLSIDTVVVRSNVADIDGAGTVYLAQSIPTDSLDAVSDLSMDVIVKELDRLEDVLDLDLLEGEGTVQLSVTGKPGSPAILIEPHLEYLSYNDVRSASIDGYVRVGDLEQLDIEAVIDVGFSVIGGFPVQQTSISLLGNHESVVFVANVTQLTGRRGTLSATYSPSIDGSELRIDDLTLNLRGVVWRLDQEAVIEIGDVWTVEHFLVYHDDGQIAIDGVIDPDGEQNLILTAEEVETSAFIDLFGIEDVGGALEGYLVLGGPSNDLVADASFRIRDLRTLGADRGNLQLGVELADGRLLVDGKIDHVSGHGATLSGSVPVNLTLEGEQTVSEVDPLDLVISADSLEVDWTLPFLDRRLVSDIGGLLDGDLTISGTWEDPELDGAASISEGQAVLPDFNTALGDIDADVSLTGDVLTINHLNATTGEGTITGTGHVDFETIADLGLGVDVKFENFRAIETNTYRFTVSGEAQVSGSMRAPVVSADVSVGPGDVFMTEELLADEVESISLTPRDLRTLERRFGYRVAASDTSTSDFIKALTLDARVNIGRDVWLRSAANPAMDIEFRGDLTVDKQPWSDQRLTGTIDVNPSRSRIIQFARRFGVDRGNITFNGLVEDAVIDFRAEYIVPSRFGGDEVRILLAVTGLMDELRLDITSEPQMDDASIASYLLTGRPPDQATVSGEQAAEIAIGGVSRLVEGFANENLGLDVVEIEASGTQGTRLTVGKYISPRSYVFVKQPITTDTNASQNNGNRGTEVGMEYELFSWLTAEVASRNGSFRGNLRWQISF